MKLKRILALLLCLIIAFSCMSFALSASAAQGKNTVKIMCIGDSLTDGDGTNSSAYRRYLYKKLVDNGYDVKFVGPKTTADSAFPAGSGHAGYAGHTVTRDYQYSVSNYLPQIKKVDYDIAIIMLGRNDSAFGKDASFEQSYYNFVDELYKANPNAILFCASVPKIRHWMANTYGWNEYDSAIKFHPIVKNIVDQFKNKGKNIHFVDMNPEACGITPGDFSDKAKNDGSGQTADMVHPLQSGYEKWGVHFYNNIKDTVGELNKNGTPSKEDSASTSSIVTSKPTTSNSSTISQAPTSSKYSPTVSTNEPTIGADDEEETGGLPIDLITKIIIGAILVIGVAIIVGIVVAIVIKKKKNN